MGVTRFLLRSIANGALLVFAAHFIPGFSFAFTRESILAGAFLLALLATFLRPVLLTITAPIRWLTLGLFSIVVHAITLLIADMLLGTLAIENNIALVIVALLFGILNAMI